MPKITFAALTAAFSALTSVATAQVWQDGYVTRDGRYVAPSYRSAPDGSPWNNYSTRGNVNPYTGQQGTVDPYPSYTPRYSNPYPNPYPSPGYGQPAPYQRRW